MDKPKIAWGTIIAGAAIAAGAVMFAPSLIDKIPALGGALVEGVKNIGEWITSLFANKVVISVGENTVTKFITAGGSAVPMAQALAGVALMGGGATYLLSGKGEDAGVPVREPSEPSESFAMKEDMRKMQALMAVRMQAAGVHPGQAEMGRA